MPIHPLLYYVDLAEKYKQRKFNGIGLFREWQHNPKIGSDCWIINPDLRIEKIKVQPESKKFDRAYKNYCVFLSEQEALDTLALIFNILQKRQFNLYRNGTDISMCIFKNFFQQELFKIGE